MKEEDSFLKKLSPHSQMFGGDINELTLGMNLVSTFKLLFMIKFTLM